MLHYISHPITRIKISYYKNYNLKAYQLNLSQCEEVLALNITSKPMHHTFIWQVLCIRSSVEVEWREGGEVEGERRSGEGDTFMYLSRENR